METGYNEVWRLLAALSALILVGPGAATPAPPPAPLAAVALAPAIAEAPAAGHARGVFFSRKVEIELPRGEAILASTPDGAGALCTDDEAIVSARGPDGASLSWAHLFADGERRVIRCIGPQPLQIERAGRYTLTITLTDRLAHTFSSRPYYLVWRSEGAMSVMAITVVPTVTSVPKRPTSAAPAPTRPPTPSSTPMPAATQPPATLEPEPASAAGVWFGRATVALAVLAVLVLLWQSRRARPVLRGIIDLADRETGEARTLLLRRYPRGLAIARRPLEPLTLPADPNRPPAVEILPGPRGPELHYLTAGQTESRVALHDGVALLIDSALELRYRRDI